MTHTQEEKGEGRREGGREGGEEGTERERQRKHGWIQTREPSTVLTRP